MSANGDHWLDRWLPLLAERAGAAPILELGCGNGRDTEVFEGTGHRVIAIDQSAEALARARTRAPHAEYHRQDIRAAWPVARQSIGVVVASLSLHYFDWQETTALVRRIGEVLVPSGVLLCRLNSTNDRHYGASGHPQIEPNLYLVSGRRKRFFDRPAIDTLFAVGWLVRYCEERSILRYDKPKIAWEIVAEVT
jgi:SAM-dependent methyltransferase